MDRAQLRTVTILVAAVVNGLWVVSARSQTTDAVGKSKFMMQGQAEQSGGQAVLDALGRPCLNVEAAARPQVVSPSMMDHVVSIKNNCPKIVHAKVCYYGSERCNELTLQPYKRADTILGTMRSVNFFRYRIIQK